MKEGLLEKIRNVSHWRRNVRPLQPLVERLTLQQCFAVVEKTKVSIRGWDFPHISRREDESGGTERHGEYIENWCDWDIFWEFWRMYRSGQFLSYQALTDEVENFNQNSNDHFLEIRDIIYSVSETLEFSRALASECKFTDGIEITISIRNSNGLRLEVGRGRMPFFDKKITHAPDIDVSMTVKPEVLASDSKEIALKVMLDLFDHFGWSPDPNQIRADQEAFLRREFR